MQGLLWLVAAGAWLDETTAGHHLVAAVLDTEQAVLAAAALVAEVVVVDVVLVLVLVAVVDVAIVVVADSLVQTRRVLPDSNLPAQEQEISKSRTTRPNRHFVACFKYLGKRL